MKRKMGRIERAAWGVMALKEACYQSVQELVGGVGALAGAWGKNPQVLINKLNPNCTTHHVNLDDLEQIIITTQDERLLQSLCSLFHAGYFFLPTCATDEAGLLEKSAKLTRELGELMQAVSTSLADGKVDADEVRLLDKALLELMASAGGLIAHAKRIGGIDQ